MKKMMFNDRYGLTQAVLEGRTTMTRRALTTEPDRVRHWNPRLGIGDAYFRDGRGMRQLISKNGDVIRPAHKVDEIVAVAQNYGYVLRQYPYWNYITSGVFQDDSGWNNKMFVKADLMPHQIRITGIRVERLQDITDEDCFREGIAETRYESTDITTYGFAYCKTGFPVEFDSPREAFAALIDRVSGRGTWERNPWVWVYEFELVK